jgi:hypothetical protein
VTNNSSKKQFWQPVSVCFYCGKSGAEHLGLEKECPPVETEVTTDHAANLATAIESYLRAMKDFNADSDMAHHDLVADTWRAIQTALHEYRKRFPLKTGADV